MAVPKRNPSAAATPILVRFFGCGDEMRGLNGDYFTVGDAGDEDVPLPAALRRLGPTKLRFSRGPESWRVTAADNLPLYVNQRRTIGLTDLQSGDVVRLAPGGPGMQLLVRQQDATVTRLAGRLAPKRAASQPPEQGGAKQQAASVATAAKGRAWVKQAGIVAALAIAMALAYLAGSIQSPPSIAPAATPAEASE